jgi:hypothetical protein
MPKAMESVEIAETVVANLEKKRAALIGCLAACWQRLNP